ncbi:hypothetical protein BKG82_26855 [Mycobacteroides chelonae]|uniref:Uncharacterized protein n=1 Tax=Mycobacteroides chelonae TaxID=1774 RepID=A0A1S1LGK0_MYCCH|nr:hypothetical protein [Mycobacteroides chelonae]OHU47275.1 hypothetical protein BKG82_26855 [Mycobacteroides chelonae]
MQSREQTTSVTDAVEQAIASGTTDSLDMVIRARYACQWGNGDALHRELADEVERLRDILRQNELDTPHTGGSRRTMGSDEVASAFPDQHPESNPRRSTDSGR